MNKGKFVFAQIVEFLPQRVFDGFVLKYFGNKRVRHFSCWNQLLCMIFGQITSRDSFRDLISILDAHQSKSYHLGLGKSISRSNFAKANETRNYRIFEDFAFHLIAIAQRKLAHDNFEIKGKFYAFDSSTIDLCLSVFWWARFRKNKGGIKLHTLLDITTQIPEYMHISSAKEHDVNAMDSIKYEAGAFYIFDRAYNDFKRLFTITQHSSFFVIRAKSNLKFKRIYSAKVDKIKGVKIDQIGKLSGFYSAKDYPEKLRKIRYFDHDSKREFVFLTNNFDLNALEIALLYKNRWKIELFFKWIKQHLKVKSFWGTTENAVRIQIYCAIITYCMVAIIGKDLKINRTTYEILQILGMSLLDKTPVNELFTKTDYKDVKERNSNQLKISWF
jgi:hypothetical protein